MGKLKIDMPEGMEAYIDGDTIKFRPISFSKNTTYEEVAVALFKNKNSFYVGNYAHIDPWFAKNDKECEYGNICTTKNQAEKLLALNKLMNVSKYLNGEWKLNWDNKDELKYYIVYNRKSDKLLILATIVENNTVVYFKSRELAEEAITILGCDIIKLALNTDW